MDVTPGLRRDPVPDLDAVGQDEQLVARIRDEIERDGPITFARFMELALYDPDGGYYRSEAARPGRDGDFLTAPEAHPIFGAALSRAVADAWDRLGRPDPFVLREYGAGTGTLALAILDGLATERPDLASAIRYEPIEVEPRRLEAIAARLAAAGHGARLTAPTSTDRPVDGFFLANEVLDALPTHRVVARDGRLREVLVGIGEGTFVDVEADPSTPALAARLADEGVTLADDQRAEICLAVDGWVAAAAAGLRRGVLLLIDYGYPAADLYDPIRRRDGTLRAYLRHRVHDDPYLHVGRQDLTAHVDVTAVERAATRGRPRASRHDHPGRVPRRARHRRAAGGHPGRSGNDDGGPTSRSVPHSSASSTRRPWAGSGSWPSGEAGRTGARWRAGQSGTPSLSTSKTAPYAIHCSLGWTTGGWFETSFQEPGAPTSRISTTGSSGTRCRRGVCVAMAPRSSAIVSGHGRTSAPPAGSGGPARASPSSGSPGSRPAGRSARSDRAEPRSRSVRGARWASGSAAA